VRGRILRDESGFTLTEMLVTMMIMTTVMFALYSIFDMSLRVFAFGNDKTEAVENARLGMAKMEREIRAAYPYNKPAGQNHLLWSPGYPTTGAIPPSNQISFGNDLNGNRMVDADEVITYRRNASTPTILEREKGGSPQPVVEYVDGLTFEYLDRYGATATSEPNVAVVHITLVIRVDRGVGGPATQTLTTDVALRNRV
jgi:prepilin-type N-terminal cleavage/methylation domain-containing protein